MDNFCKENFTEMFTKLILLLSVSKASPPSNCYKSTIQSLKNMFSNLGSVVVSANILLDNETNITVDILTRMMTTICYHSPQLLKSIVTGQIRVILFQKVFIEELQFAFCSFVAKPISCLQRVLFRIISIHHKWEYCRINQNNLYHNLCCNSDWESR